MHRAPLALGLMTTADALSGLLGIYFKQGYIDPGFTFLVLLGVLAGSLTGARILTIIKNRTLRIILGGL